MTLADIQLSFLLFNPCENVDARSTVVVAVSLARSLSQALFDNRVAFKRINALSMVHPVQVRAVFSRTSLTSPSVARMASTLLVALSTFPQ